MDPVDLIYSMDWTYVCLLDMLSQVIRTLMYIVESKLLLPRDVNPVRTHFTLFQISKMRWILLSISIHFINEGLQRCLPVCVMIYICVACLIYTIVPVNSWEKLSENNCPFLAVTWQIIRSLEKCSAALCWYLPLIIFLFPEKFLPLRALNFWCHFKNWTHFTDPFFLLPSLNHLSTFFISSLFLFFLGLFSSRSQIDQLFHKTNLAHIRYIYCIPNLYSEMRMG